jgi:hypothetical protein
VTARETLARIEKEFGRIGLLLQHDRDLPSVTTLVVGKPIKGSWWGHRRGKEIYALLEEFHEGAGALSAKLVNGKITYVHRRLWSAFLELTMHGQRTRVRLLSVAAKSLHKVVTDETIVRVDELAATGFASAKELAGAARELEESVLVHGDSIHTASGAHTKVLQSWPGWVSANGVTRSKTYSLSRARREFAEALHRLQGESTHPLTMPLPVGRRR